MVGLRSDKHHIRQREEHHHFTSGRKMLWFLIVRNSSRAQNIQEAHAANNIIKYCIIGVIKDIRFEETQSSIRPLLFFGTKTTINYMADIVR
ncbi:hypothetical protein [Acetobacter indonesiensis]|uniref:Uncharacterized protein n=1 Tax=Acetobacter indonesiensis TaxID=104101 RepID=A0ABQ0K4Z6_9PROT|nr:hypothetical protein [Acetobacter indonesiensis]GAN61986.1 hypothetical protein Abin_005_009 [Acetobacter indonesiensis]